MNISNELVDKFFQDKCTIEEVSEVVQYLNENPDVLQKYMSEKEWSDFGIVAKLHPAVSEKMLSAIRKSTTEEVKSRIWLKYAAAAAVLFSIVFGISFLLNENKDQKNLISVKPLIKSSLKVISNNTSDNKQILLEDGSIVSLATNSELSYFEPFEPNKRRLFIKGQAIFSVAKDSSKPFTVYSNEISTTALGTKFKVVSFEKMNLIAVKLYEGKVRITQTEDGAKRSKGNYYLFAGDEFNFNKKTQKGSIKKYIKVPEVVKGNLIEQQQNTAPNWYMFNNQSLVQVFEQLSAIYNVKIVYTTADVKKMNFIGKIDKTDSIENILNDIALLNNLSVKKSGSSYVIKKK
jgi:ferric-dicitrate binding protein FerR (iron transport regulator)